MRNARWEKRERKIPNDERERERKGGERNHTGFLERERDKDTAYRKGCCWDEMGIGMALLLFVYFSLLFFF